MEPTAERLSVSIKSDPQRLISIVIAALNQEQMKEAVAELQDESEELGKVLIELRTLQTAMNNRLEMLTARVDGETTGGWARRQRDGG